MIDNFLNTPECTGNALCMLSYSACHEIGKSSTLDKILHYDIFLMSG